MILSSDSIDQFRSSLIADGAAPNTVKAYVADLKGLLTFMQENPELKVAEAMAQHLNANRADWSPATTSRKKASYRKYAAWLEMPHVLERYKAPSVPAGVPHPIQGGIERVHQMIEAARSREHKAMIALTGLCGLRIGEAITLKRKHIVVKDGNLWAVFRGKGDKQRRVPISDTTAAIIGPLVFARGNEEMLVGIEHRAARRAVKRIAERAGIPHPVATHDLRMTYGTTILDETGNIRLAQELLGHASMDQTATYTLVGEKALLEAARAIG